MPSLPAKIKVLLILAKNSWKTEFRKLQLVSNILWMIVARLYFPVNNLLQNLTIQKVYNE